MENLSLQRLSPRILEAKIWYQLGIFAPCSGSESKKYLILVDCLFSWEGKGGKEKGVGHSEYRMMRLLIFSTQCLLAARHLLMWGDWGSRCYNRVEHRDESPEHSFSFWSREKLFQIIRLGPHWSLRSMSEQYKTGKRRCGPLPASDWTCKWTPWQLRILNQCVSCLLWGSHQHSVNTMILDWKQYYMDFKKERKNS